MERLLNEEPNEKSILFLRHVLISVLQETSSEILYLLGLLPVQLHPDPPPLMQPGSSAVISSKSLGGGGKIGADFPKSSENDSEN